MTWDERIRRAESKVKPAFELNDRCVVARCRSCAVGERLGLQHLDGTTIANRYVAFEAGNAGIGGRFTTAVYYDNVSLARRLLTEIQAIPVDKP